MRTSVFTSRRTWPRLLRTWQMPCFKPEWGAGSLFKKLNSTYFLFFLFSSLSFFVSLFLSSLPFPFLLIKFFSQALPAWLMCLSPTKRSLALTGQGPLEAEESPWALSSGLDPPAGKVPLAQTSLDSVWTPAPIKKAVCDSVCSEPQPWRDREKFQAQWC